jgi:hypothetical protein
MTISRKEYAEAFKAAKKYLSYGQLYNIIDSDDAKTTCICWALDDSIREHNTPRHVVRAAQALINERLGGHHSVCDYLSCGLGISHTSLTLKAVQTFRHEWLDQLISEFSK